MPRIEDPPLGLSVAVEPVKRKTEVAGYNYDLPTTSYFYRKVISPVCDWLVNNVVPESVSPDFLTVMGLVFSMMAPLALPKFPMLACTLWVCYGLCDNMDGKQARRLKRSSIRGEFLDHFADSIASSLLIYMLSFGFLRQYPTTHFAIFLSCQVPFLLGCWYYNCSGKILLGSQTALGVQVTVDEINFLLVPTLYLTNFFLSDNLFRLIQNYSFWIAMIFSLGCLIEDIRVLIQISSFLSFRNRTQLRIGMTAVLYLCSICAVTKCSNPAITIPVFAWLCSTLIYPQCAKKAGSQPMILQSACVMPALASLLLTAFYLSNWYWLFIGAVLVTGGIFSWILWTQLRALPGSK